MNIRDTLFNESIRTEQIIWLSGQTDQIADDLRRFFNESSDTTEAVSEVLGIELTPTEAENFEDGELSDDDIVDILNRMDDVGRAGFLVSAGTPVPQSFGEDGSYSTSGFGFYTTKWFYTDSFDEAFMNRLVEWKEAFVEHRKALEKNPA